MELRDDADLYADSGDFEVMYLLMSLITVCIIAFIVTH